MQNEDPHFVKYSFGMKNQLFKCLLLALLLLEINSLSAAEDWAQFGKYQLENDSIMKLPENQRPKVIFMGNSITEGWAKEDPDFFKANNFLGRGISGQTTYQMLNRFREDVINLNPELVVITAGTNDVAENNHNYNEDITLGNIISMAELARANNIKVVLTSVLPTDHFYWNPEMSGIPEKLISLNKGIKAYADSQSIPYADYFSEMHNDSYAMKEGLSIDGVHPSLDGYKMMEQIIMPVISSCFVEMSPETFALWDTESPATFNGLKEDCESQENPGWISMVTKPEMYVYPAQNPNGTALLMLPGGGYGGVAILHEGKELAPVLNEEGITLAVLKYRMPNGHKEVPLEDVSKAMKLLLENSEKWGINPDKIGIGGASAGGHLAATYATHENDSDLKPAFQVLFYPVISMKDSITHSDTRRNFLGENPSDDMINLYSNELQVGPSTPPALILVSGDDTLVPVENSIVYTQALLKENIPVALHIYPKGDHGWGTNKDFPYHEEMLQELTTWLKSM